MVGRGGGGAKLQAIELGFPPSDTERVQPTPDTLVSAPLCSLCSKRLQTSCAGAVNLSGGFDTERKASGEVGGYWTECAVWRLDGLVLVVEPCGPMPGGTPGWGG